MATVQLLGSVVVGPDDAIRLGLHSPHSIYISYLLVCLFMLKYLSSRKCCTKLECKLSTQ